MVAKNDVSQGGIGGSGKSGVQQNGAELGWKELKPISRRKRGNGRRRLFAIVSLVLLIALIFTAIRVASVASATDEQLTLTIGGQQSAQLDLRQSLPISPYLFGVNVFPKAGTNSIDGLSTGFMSYGPEVVNGLQSAGVNLLRFPGGSWGENVALQNHILSYNQLYDFSNLLYQTGAQGMIQARLSSPIDKFNPHPTLTERADLAGDWVDFMNNPHSQWRKGKLATAQIHPVTLWTVGNEPDRLTDPDTGQPFTVAGYVKDFIAYSIIMHENNPTIKVFGPELSQFYGVGIGPRDQGGTGTLWMEGFLQGVAAYEKAHPNLGFHLLDGVSFHTYPFLDAQTSPYLLMSSSQEWNYLLPQLRQTIQQIMGRSLPIAITEINSTPSIGTLPTRGQAALWWADTLGTLMDQGVEYTAYFSAQGVEHPYPLFSGQQNPQQTSMYRVFQLFSHLQHNLLPLEVQRDPINAFATIDDARQTLSILFVNKSSVNQTANITPQSQAFGFSPWHAQQVNIAANSIVLITLHRSSGAAQAYSFIVPSTNSASIAPLTQTICGNNYDPLAYSIPC